MEFISYGLNVFSINYVMPNALKRFNCLYNLSVMRHKNYLAKHVNLNKKEVKTRRTTGSRHDGRKYGNNIESSLRFH